MKTTTSLTAFVLAGATALALAVPTLAPRLADRLAPALTLPAAAVTLPWASGDASPADTGATDPWSGTVGRRWPGPASGFPDQGSTGWGQEGSWDQGSSSGGSGSGAAGSTPPGASASGPGTTTTEQTAAPTPDQTRGVVLIQATVSGGEAAGTGMVLTADGQVLTNYHVVQGSTQVQVEVVDTGRVYTATVVGHDAARDVALLQLEGASGLATITPDADRVAVGQSLTAVGNASGGGELVAAPGTVTALEQQVTVNGDNGGSETLSGVIATNAGAVPGDSGGPMFDDEGEVLGMTTAGSQTTNAAPGGGGRQSTTATTTASFAVPIADALSVVNQIRTGKESGTVQVGARAYLGISVASSSGLQVASVESGGPAAKAGVEVGATITAIDGTRVTTQSELSSALDRIDPGAKASLTWVDADGVTHTATVTLGSSPVN